MTKGKEAQIPSFSAEEKSLKYIQPWNLFDCCSIWGYFYDFRRKRSLYGIHHSKGIQCGIKATCFTRAKKHASTQMLAMFPSFFAQQLVFTVGQ